MKKLLSVLLVAAMVLGLVGTAFGATDVTGTKFDTAVTRLNALSILRGYEDGSFKPNNNITRAEFAAVAVRAMGLDEAAKNTIGLTKFKDVTGTHWAAGYINVAVGRGIVKGYPDGTFKPEANVTNAEAMAMLIRVLGYEPAVTGEWPMNYVSKAAEIGVTKGVALSTDLAAIRGDVALMTNNALTIKLMVQSTYGSLSGYTVSTQTLLVDKLGCTELKGVIVNATPNFDRVALKANEVKLGADVYTFDAALNVEALIGHEVDAWAKSGNVFYIADKTSASSIVSFTVKAADATTITYEGPDSNTAADDVVYTVSGTEKVFYNHVGTTMAALNVVDPGANLKGASVTLVLDDTNKVAFVTGLEYATSSVVTKVDTTAQTIKVVDAAGAETTITLKDTKNTIVDATGAVKALADVAKNDVLSVATNGAPTQYWVRFVRNAVSGDVTKITTTDEGTLSKYKVYVGTTAYSVASNGSSRNGTTYTALTAGNVQTTLLGSKGTFFLDASGKIRLADLTKAASAKNYGFVDTVAWNVPSASGSTNRYIKILKLDGTKAALAIDVADETAVDSVGHFFTYTVDTDGAIDSVAAINWAADGNGTGVATPNNTYDRLAIAAGSTYVVTADTKIYDQTAGAATKPVAIGWAVVEGGTAPFTATVLANADFPNRADVVIFSAGTFATSTSTSVLLKSYTSVSTSSGTERHMIVDENGTEKDYVIEAGLDTSTFTLDEIADLTFNADNEVDGFTVLTADESAVVIATGDLDTTAGILVGTGTYFKTKDTVVYDATGTTVKVDWSVLAVGQTVDIFEDGSGNLTFVVITDK